MRPVTLADGTSCGTWVAYKLDEHDKFVVTAEVRRELAASAYERGDNAAARRSEQKAEELDTADFACGNSVNERTFFVTILTLVGVAVIVANRNSERVSP